MLEYPVTLIVLYIENCKHFPGIISEASEHIRYHTQLRFHSFACPLINLSSMTFILHAFTKSSVQEMPELAHIRFSANSDI